MALVLGTNSGFVTETPENVSESGRIADLYANVTKDTSPATAGKIVEIGWYCNTATQEANFQVGLYAADGEVVPGEAGTLLYSNAGNAKGTTTGWKKVTVDWEILPNTVYWLGMHCSNTATTTYIANEGSGGVGRDARSGQANLPNPFAGGAIADADAMYAIYAIWEEAAPTNINPKVKVAGTFATKKTLVKIGGTFAEKPVLVKVGGAFQ